jgi:hypothetical protein
MNAKKFWIAFVVVFVLLELMSYLINGLILSSTYSEEGVKQLFRPEEEMQSKMWIIWVTDLIWSFFFVFMFVKGYENKGIMEGVRYGIYIGLFFGLVMAYQSFAMFSMPYSLALTWFLVSFVMSIILGIVAAAIYKPKAAEVS